MIREYFLKYSECMSNDFVISEGGRKVEPLTRDIEDWRITFVDTGMHANLGQRLMRVRKYLEGEEMFLANYSDGLSNLPLNDYIDEFKRRNVTAGLVAVRPSQSLHAVRVDDGGVVSAIESVADSDYWINAGFFCLRQEIFDHIEDGEELVEAPFRRLIAKRQLWSHRHPGFWAAMDTMKDKITLDRMEARGDCPWMVWKQPPASRAG